MEQQYHVGLGFLVRKGEGTVLKRVQVDNDMIWNIGTNCIQTSLQCYCSECASTKYGKMYAFKEQLSQEQRICRNVHYK